MLNKYRTNTFIVIFSIIELILCILVQITNGTANIVVSYTAVVIAFLFSLLHFETDKFYLLTLTGLLCTVFADLFLVVVEPIKQIPAMFFFSITQICYFIRIYLKQDDKKESTIHIIIRILVILTCIIATIIVLKDKTDCLSLISLFYYANLLVNTIFAFVYFNKNKLFAIGLLCFTLCDLFIGFSILDQSYISIKENSILYFLCNPGFNIAWLFYVPSQTLISLSCIKSIRK